MKSMNGFELENFYVMVKAYFPSAVVKTVDDKAGICLLKTRKNDYHRNTDYIADVVYTDKGLVYSVIEREYVSYGWFTTIYVNTTDESEFMHTLGALKDGCYED